MDNEGEVLDFLVQRKRDAKAAKKLMKKLLKKHGFAPSRIVARTCDQAAALAVFQASNDAVRSSL